MKIIYSLFISIFTILLIASCDSSTSADTQDQGTRIGTWMVYDNAAEWVGIQSHSKAKRFTTQAEGDTVYFDNPDGNSVRLIHAGKENNFGVSYIDSSYNATAEFDILNENPFLNEARFLSIGLREDHIEVLTSVNNIVCDSIYTEKENFIYHYYDEYNPEVDTNKVVKTVELNTAGVVDAAKTLIGCN